MQHDASIDPNPTRLISVARVYRPDGTSSKISPPSSGGTDDVVRLLSGDVREDVLATLPTAVRIARRIVPWADVVLAPRILLVRDPIPNFPSLARGADVHRVGGVASKPLETIYLSMSSTTAYLLEAACHEAWHLIEGRPSHDWRERIDAELVTPIWTVGDDYWADPEECRARAFEARRRRLIEGMPAPVYIRENGRRRGSIRFFAGVVRRARPGADDD